MSQIQVKKTKKELARLLEDSEARNRMMKTHAETCEKELIKWRPKGQRYNLNVSSGNWTNLSWEEIETKAKLLLEAGAVFQITFGDKGP